MERIFRFYKNSKHAWYVDLPEWAGDPEELQMVEGADLWLEKLDNGRGELQLKMADVCIEGADVLTLFHKRDPKLSGGGDYLLETLGGTAIYLEIWLCAVTEFVFQDLPERIWFEKIK